MKKKLIVLLASLILISPFLITGTANASSRNFEQFQSGITLPNRRLRTAERNAWIDEYWLMGGPNAFEFEVIRIINNVRRDNNLSRLRIDYTAGMAARFHTQIMDNLNTDMGFNVGPYRIQSGDDSATNEILRVFGGNVGGSDVIARGHNTPARLVESLMESDIRESLLRDDVRFIGVGRHGEYTFIYLTYDASNPRLYITPINTQAIVRSSTTAMREDPANNGSVLQTLSRGEEVRVTGISNDGWMRVVVGRETGWVQANAMREIQRTGIITQRTALRQSPNNNSGDVRNLSRNTEVTILGTHGNWSQVQRGRSVGWVRTSRVSEVSQSAFVEVSRANLRTGPSSSFERITRVNRNVQVTVIGQSGSWLQVRSGRHEGWVAASDVRIADVHGTTRRSTALREGASSSTTRMRTLANNTPLLILGESGSWTHVQQGNRVGWVRTSDLNTTNHSSTTRATATLRTRPRSNASSITRVNSGASVRAIAVHGNWSLVRVGNNTGWMRTADIR